MVSLPPLPLDLKKLLMPSENALLGYAGPPGAIKPNPLRSTQPSRPVHAPHDPYLDQGIQPLGVPSLFPFSVILRSPSLCWRHKGQQHLVLCRSCVNSRKCQCRHQPSDLGGRGGEWTRSIAWPQRMDAQDSVYFSPTLSKSRISTAICARFAASATRVKSFRNTSVDAVLTGFGAGGTILLVGDCCVEDMLLEVDRVSILVEAGGRKLSLGSLSLNRWG